MIRSAQSVLAQSQEMALQIERDAQLELAAGLSSDFEALKPESRKIPAAESAGATQGSLENPAAASSADDPDSSPRDASSKPFQSNTKGVKKK